MWMWHVANSTLKVLPAAFLLPTATAPCCRANAEVMAAAADMLEVYCSQKEALIHNDLHAGEEEGGQSS